MALEETIQCVESILNNIEGDKKVIVVDNCSPNNTGADLEKRYAGSGNVDVLQTGKNLGFAKGNNFGYGYAVQNYDPDFVVVMNNDMEIRQQDFISRMEKSWEEHRFAVMGPDIYSTKKKYHQNPQTRKMPTRKDLESSCRNLELKDKLSFLIALKWKIYALMGRKPAEEKRAENYVDHVVEDPLLHGSCYIFSRDFTVRHPQECFYPETFMYLEAEILCYQCRRDGEKMIYDPRLRVDHHEDVATDLEYHKQSRKSIFTVKCMLQSVKAFLALMDRDGN
jgi:GT2 family glycosyltransferase